jgi:hypothetical protein
MYVAFETLSDNSRVWIYQADRKLTGSEVARLESALRSFCEQWAAHGEPLKTSYRVEHNQFVVLCADEDYLVPSGCSIDTSVRMLKEFQTSAGLNFFDRTRVAFLNAGQVTTAMLAELKDLFASGSLRGTTITFDNLVPSKGDFLRRWTVPSEKTWLAKYLPKSALA